MSGLKAFHGSIVVIKRNGKDGSVFPLVEDSCLLGRGEWCDIRVQLPTVSREHCALSAAPKAGRVQLCALSASADTLLNGGALSANKKVELSHGDVFTLGDRSFRWEYQDQDQDGDNSEKVLSPKEKAKAKKATTPGKEFRILSPKNKVPTPKSAGRKQPKGCLLYTSPSPRDS